MNPTDLELSAICESATIFDIEEGYVYPYPDLYIEPFKPDTFIKLEPVTHSYLVYWPCGLAAYIVTPLASHQLRPAFIEAAHATAKLLKPFSPLKRRAR